LKAVSENIQCDMPCIRERCVKSFLRHHFPRATAEKPVALVDPYLKLWRGGIMPTFKGGKPTMYPAKHYRPCGGEGGVVLRTSRKYSAVSPLRVSLLKYSERVSV
jgi:hypothetical protein